MANHVIYDRIWESKKLGRCSKLAALAYPWIYLVADDWGRFERAPRAIWGKVFTKRKDIREADVDAWLTEYEREGLLIRYRVGDLDLCSWTKFVGPPPSRRRVATIPGPDGTCERDGLKARSRFHSALQNDTQNDPGTLPNNGASCRADGVKNGASWRPDVVVHPCTNVFGPGDALDDYASATKVGVNSACSAVPTRTGSVNVELGVPEGSSTYRRPAQQVGSDAAAVMQRVGSAVAAKPQHDCSPEAGSWKLEAEAEEDPFVVVDGGRPGGDDDEGALPRPAPVDEGLPPRPEPVATSPQPPPLIDDAVACPDCRRIGALRRDRTGLAWFCGTRNLGCGAKFALDYPGIVRQLSQRAQDPIAERMARERAGAPAARASPAALNGRSQSVGARNLVALEEFAARRRDAAAAAAAGPADQVCTGDQQARRRLPSGS